MQPQTWTAIDQSMVIPLPNLAFAALAQASLSAQDSTSYLSTATL